MNTYQAVVKELVRYIKSHLMDDLKTQTAIDYCMYLLRSYGTSALYLDEKRVVQFRPSFMLEVEAALLGVYGQTH